MRQTLILLTSLSMVLTSCAQKNKIEPSKMKIRNQHITLDNVVKETLKKVKHYNEESQYFIRPVHNNCIYEILVNDFPAYHDYSLDVLATPIEINDAILKSGEQTITVRMYPVGDLLKDNYDIGDTVNTLLDNTSMKIEVVKYDAYNLSHRLDDEKTVLTHYSPTKADNKKFIGAGLPYYEYTFSFNAEVPYENEGWLNGEDLTKFNKDELENKLLIFFNDYKKLYENNDNDNLVRFDFDQTTRGFISYYRNKEYIEEFWDEYEEPKDFKNKEYQPVKNYNLEFYGNNRIVTLRYPIIKPIDERLKGKSAFWFKYKEEGRIMAYWITLYAYIPKGGNLSDLQSIK